MVLICSDSHEACLREDKGAEVPVSTQVTVGSRIHVHYVEAWLVAMHGVQYHLTMIKLEKNTKKASQRSASFLLRSCYVIFFCSQRQKHARLTEKRVTDMPVVIQKVVGKLESVEGYSLLHPLASTGRRVWVEVHPARGYDIGSPCH